MANVLKVLPELQGEEQIFVQKLIQEMDDETAQQFAAAYRSRRRDPQIILLTALVGFLGFAGIQRFLVDQIGMGILYLLTAGLCFIGTIVDIVTYRDIAFQYNQRQAQEIAAMLTP
ncbi:MAG: TM2 domain-containing protein [Calditrichaeota bacterium]|nr:MAG: TM2 domain-containing protein [Calditrichota bacterium]